MAVETIEAVRNAEQFAMQKEKEALKERDAILLKAQQDANELISVTTKGAQKKAKSDLEMAQIQGTKVIEEAKLRANGEIIKLKETVSKKEQEAIKLIISTIA